MDEHIFIEDGATAYTSKTPWTGWSTTSEPMWFQRTLEFNWSQYSPDCNPLHYFLWGYLKDSVNRHNPLRIQKLKTALKNKTRKIDATLCAQVTAKFQEVTGGVCWTKWPTYWALNVTWQAIECFCFAMKFNSSKCSFLQFPPLNMHVSVPSGDSRNVLRIKRSTFLTDIIFSNPLNFGYFLGLLIGLENYRQIVITTFCWPLIWCVSY